jgi:hypothetical protein
MNRVRSAASVRHGAVDRGTRTRAPVEGVPRDGCSRRLEPARGLCADAADHGAAGAADPAEAAAPLLADEPLLDEPEDDPPSEEVDEAADAATDELLEPLPVLLDRESVR